MKLESVEELRFFLNQFNDQTVKLINMVEDEDYDNLDKALSLREETINIINSMKYDGEVFRSLCIDLKVVQLQQKLQNLMNHKKLKIQNEINTINDKNIANKKYNKSFNVDSLYLSKKI